MREIKFRAWDTKYEVGDDGSVWSLDFNHTGTRQRMRHYLDQDGYPYVFLQNKGTRTKLVIHRAVAKLFLSVPPTLKHQVNHKDGVRHNGDISNLEWVTSRENTIDGWKRGRKISDDQKTKMKAGTRAFNARRWGHENPELLREVPK